MTKKKPTKKTAKETTATIELRNAIGARLVELAAKPTTPRTLTEIRQTSDLGHRLLMVSADPTCRPRRGGLDPIDYEEHGPYTLDGLPSSPAVTANAETFFSKVVREAVTAWTGTQNKPHAPTPSDFIEAITLARAHGQTDIAEKMEAQLLASMRAPSLVPLLTLPAMPCATSNGHPAPVVHAAPSAPVPGDAS